MCNVLEVHGRVRKEHEGKGDTGKLGRRKEKQETAKRPQETARRLQGDAGRRRETQGDAGRHRETQGDAGNRVARLSKE